jgi:hypothetical protein
MKVAIEPAPASQATAPGASFAERLKADFKDSTLIEIVNEEDRQPAVGSAPWDVMVKRGLFKNIKSDLTNLPTGVDAPNDDTEVYYLIKGNIDKPLYDFWVDPNVADSQDRLRTALEKTAKQNNLRKLANATSPLKDVVRIIVVRVAGSRDAAGNFTATGEEVRPADQIGTAPFKLGEPNEFYRFKIENRSKQKLFITFILLGSSGSVRIFNRGKKALEIPRGGSADFSCKLSTRIV